MPSYSGLWNGVYGVNHSLLTNAMGNRRTAFNRVFSGRNYGRQELKQLIITLVNGAVGDNATAGHKRVAARRELDANVQGGKVPIETVNSISRNTTADDVTNLLAALNAKSSPNAYARDLSGNGGGGKLNY